MADRNTLLEYAKHTEFDIAIIGGGINGACAYHHLCQAGYKVLLVDKGDFAGATSQASGMMIWGGLLYLKNLDLFTVYKFSRARDAMIRYMQDHVSCTPYRYMPAISGQRSKYFVYSGLYLYWLLGHFRRKAPVSENRFNELSLLAEGKFNGSLLYEESMLRQSDSRFVLHWISPHQSEFQVPLNYCALDAGSYSNRDKNWHLEMSDQLTAKAFPVRCRYVINCAGVWTDSVNDAFGIDSPYRHMFGKGVYISTKRPEGHQTPLIFEMGKEGDTLTYVPWGPVSMWGPTETFSNDLESGFSAEPEDIRFLLESINRNIKTTFTKQDIVSLRCGVRPLAVRKNRGDSRYPLDISRHARIVISREKAWCSVYGGKITGCTQVASKLVRKVRNMLPAPTQFNQLPTLPETVFDTAFPGLDDSLPSIDWCMEHEFCHTLDDYLRRRTNIAQWIPRQGLGANGENSAYLQQLALALAHGDSEMATGMVQKHRQMVHRNFEQLIDRI